ncbi:hypothetical protein [Moorena sp. SIO3I8]|uniref:hypothetical protein n=1 Tax=Moorena sp. SIO3I8 TaxID=2607833 RepID=UPI0025D33022|nr:hypothetical protein [Moorena sp. SIO3I8]
MSEVNGLTECFEASVPEDVRLQALRKFFSHKWSRKPTKKEMKENLGLCEKTVNRWHRQIVNAPQSGSEKIPLVIELNFYRRQKRQLGRRYIGFTLYQVFVFYLISLLRKNNDYSYSSTSRHLALLLKFFDANFFRNYQQP